MRMLSLAPIGALALLSCDEAEPSKRTFLPEALSAALADPARAAHRAADSRRKAAELITFAGVRPGDKVLDLIPGDGYWTRIFAKTVGPEGKVYAVWPINYGRVALGNVETLRQLSADANYGNIVTQVQPTTTLTAREPLDVVWTSQNYHDYPDEFMGKADPLVLNNAVFQILKPGGTYLVIDHMAEAGSGMRDTENFHRIDPAIVRSQVEAAGFKFAGESKVLNNPADPLNVAVFDPSIRGRTSQFAYRFVKP
jgi:predicted methyltransferase